MNFFEPKKKKKKIKDIQEISTLYFSIFNYNIINAIYANTQKKKQDNKQKYIKQIKVLLSKKEIMTKTNRQTKKWKG